MLIQTNTTDNQNQIGAAADMRSEGMNEVFAIGNMLYIESVLIENSSAIMAAAIRDELGNLFVTLDRVLNEKTTKPVEPILNALRNLIASLHTGLIIEESDVVRLDKHIARIEKILIGSLLLPLNQDYSLEL